MGAVGLLRELWRLRVIVALGALLAVMSGVAVAYRVSFPPHIEGRQYQVGIASSSALIDTPSSQVVDLGRKSSAAGPSLPGRAALLASLLTTSPLKDEIARRAGIDPRTLIASAPAAEIGASGAKKTAPLATGATVAPDDPRASSLTLQTDVTLPIITVNAEARDPAVAKRLADGAIATLENHVTQQAGQDAVPANQRLSVKQLGAANTAIQTRGVGKSLALVVAVFVFGLVCAAILVVSAMAKEWRRTSALEAAERLREEPEPEPEVGLEPEPEPENHWDAGKLDADPEQRSRRLRHDVVA